MSKKKKILWQSNYAFAKTGLGRNTKAVLTYLYNTNKYEVINYAQGMPLHHDDYQRFPWKTIGCLPMTQEEINEINKDPNYARACSYGAYYLDRVVHEEKPDIMFFSDDWWAFSGYYDKPWWNKFHCVFHITLDSLPILKEAVDNASKIKNFFVWTDFAEHEMHRLGHHQVKTLHGAVDHSSFFRLSEEKRRQLRKKNNIEENAIIFGFVFRNQLRKEVIPLMEGFRDFLKTIPSNQPAYLLFHTNITEGWNIEAACDELGIDKKRVLVSYICKNCREIEVKHIQGHDLNCPICRAEKTQITPNVAFGATEEQLNEVYNIMDGYFQLANAGGLEIPLIEALYTELPCATMNYSFGETFCSQPFIFSVDFHETRQIQTQFRRACPNVYSVSKIMKKMFEMLEQKKREIGRSGRAWAISEFSPDVIGKQIERFIDSLPDIDYNFNFSNKQKNPDYNPPQIEDDTTWLIDIYKNILNMTVDSNEDGCKMWATQLKNGAPRQQILDYFRQVARNDNSKESKSEFTSFLSNDDEGRRIFFMMPESAGDVFMATSLLPSIKERYPDYNIYFCTKPQYFSLLDGNELIHKIVPYDPRLESIIFLEGQLSHRGFFEVAFLPHIGTQRHLNYLHNGRSDMIMFDIYADDFNKYTI